METVKKIKDESNFIKRFRNNILAWYDIHRRSLPWRAPSVGDANPYHVWLSEIMLQQTTVPTVIPYFLKFTGMWPDIYALAAASEEDIMKEWAGLGYYARARNLHKCARVIVNEHQGQFPKQLEALKSLPGIGDYTASAIRSIAFDLPSTVVDGNVERIMSRVFAIKTPFPEGKKEAKYWAHILADKQQQRPSDYAQSLMDLGSMVCTPSSPSCETCPLSFGCKAYQLNKPADFPIKGKKKERPKRHGVVYWLTDSKGQALYVKRPPKGLLGGMMALPSTEWGAELDIGNEMFQGIRFKDSHQFITHIFTHFELRLNIYTAKVEDLLSLPLQSSYKIYPIDKGSALGLPTVFKKAYLLAKDL